SGFIKAGLTLRFVEPDFAEPVLATFSDCFFAMNSPFGVSSCAAKSLQRGGSSHSTGHMYAPYGRQAKECRNSMAGGPGFEPGLPESESGVLPLNYPPKGLPSCERGF